MVRWFKNRRKPRFLVIGLDCAAPELIFEQFRDDLPNLTHLMSHGMWGRLESSVPCITIPAWSSMLSSRDPGALGFYGFRNRTDYSYTPMQVVNGSAVRVPRVWDILSDAQREAVVVGVPQTYPVRPLNGTLVSGFLTPGRSSAFTYPAIFQQEVLKHSPHYEFDVKDFRTEDKAALLRRLYDLSDVQFELFKHALSTRNWDFAMYVNIAVDRLHHAFWRFHDPQHRLYEAGNRYQHAIRDYYVMIDRRIGEILEYINGNTVVMIVSDHGVKRMDGGICINEWLWRNGWLNLKELPPQGNITRFDTLEVDWTQTRAWGAGGYYGRVFLNVKGREPQGIIPQEDIQAVKEELACALKSISAPDGTSLNTTVMYPEAVYSQINNIPPDLIVYFGDLHWRSVGSMGYGSDYTLENDTGSDDANHDTHGIFILYDPRSKVRGNVDDAHLMDIAPTILDRMRVPIPTEMQGEVIK